MTTRNDDNPDYVAKLLDTTLLLQQIAQRSRYHTRRRLFRIADVQHAPSIPLYVDRLVHRVAENGFAAAVVQVRDPANVVLRFPEMRNPRAARHRSRTSVIGCQTEANVAAVAIQQFP